MNDFNMAETGQRIKGLRLSLGFTQKELADQIGVAQNTIAQYEKGKAKTSIEAIVSLANILQTTTDYLLLGKE